MKKQPILFLSAIITSTAIIPSIWIIDRSGADEERIKDLESRINRLVADYDRFEEELDRLKSILDRSIEDLRPKVTSNLDKLGFVEILSKIV